MVIQFVEDNGKPTYIFKGAGNVILLSSDPLAQRLLGLPEKNGSFRLNGSSTDVERHKMI